MRVIVFIDGPYPSEADLALAAEHGTKVFRNGRQEAGFEPHDLAVANDQALIPKGFKSTVEAEAPAPIPPVVNPLVPKKVAPRPATAPVVPEE